MKQVLANDASRKTAEKEAARQKKEAAKQKLKERVAAMVTPNEKTGIPQVNKIPAKPVIQPRPTPAVATPEAKTAAPTPSSKNKSKIKQRVATKTKTKSTGDDGYQSYVSKKRSEYKKQGINASDPTRHDYEQYRKYGDR